MIGYKESTLIHPKGKRTADCVVRAIAVTIDTPYDQVIDELVSIYKKTGYHMSDNKCYSKLLAEHGFTQLKQFKKPNGNKYTVRELGQVLSEDYVAVVNVAHHLVTIRGGFIYDIWDCRLKTSGKVYVKKLEGSVEPINVNHVGKRKGVLL